MVSENEKENHVKFDHWMGSSNWRLKAEQVTEDLIPPT